MQRTCPTCYHTVDVPDAVSDQSCRCPNCGVWVEVSPPVAPLTTPTANARSARHPGEGAAVASLICSLIFCVPVLAQVVAIAAGVAALVQMRHEGRRKGLAVAGIMLGLLFLGGWVFLIGKAGWPGTTSIATRTYITSTGRQTEVYEDVDAEQLRASLERLSAAVHAYRRDMGRWPARMDALSPTYLNLAVLDQIDPDRAPTANRLVTFEADVDPLHDRPDRVVAWSVEWEFDEFGNQVEEPLRWVMLLNGEVKTRPSSELELNQESETAEPDKRGGRNGGVGESELGIPPLQSKG